jgi:aminoglycoside phosphotransferase (APT) family kinase protein
MSRQSDLVFMEERLGRWAREHVGPGAEVVGLERLPGHSSITLAFDVAEGGAVRERLVLRCVPEGVPRRGSTDVLRQAPLLELMEASGVPVPRVRWASADESWFGVDHLIVDRVGGSTLGDVFAADGAPPPASDPGALFAQAVDALAAIHGARWGEALAGWDAPLLLGDEIDRWVPLLRKAGDPDGVNRGAWVDAGLRVRELLHAGRPHDPEPGVVHGDFYSNNWMFSGERLTAVLDWETAFLGPRPLDVGWLCMMYDPASWSPARRPDLAWTPSPEFLIERYCARTGETVPALDWYRALAGYRLAALTSHYLHLHVTGRRVDDVWPGMGESVPAMLARAQELASGPAA